VDVVGKLMAQIEICMRHLGWLAGLILLFIPPASMAGDRSAASLVGPWVCRPYESANPTHGQMTVTEKKLFLVDGSYESQRSFLHVFPSGAKIAGKFELLGKWKLSGRILHLYFEKAKFISSDNLAYPMEKGQEDVDAILKKVPGITERVIRFDPLITKVIIPKSDDNSLEQCAPRKGSNAAAPNKEPD
jgi:hypothetical protein